MKEYLSILQASKLFAGVSADEILAMSSCLNARISSYKKGEFVYKEGDVPQNITILLSGKLHIQHGDYWGNCNIISTIEPAEMFGEAYLTPNSGRLVNNIIAVEDSTLVFLDARLMLMHCPNGCKHHAVVIQNLVYAIADKNRKLMQKLGYISNRSTRAKLMSYLSDESARQGSNSFNIPFNRQELADFLSVDRSAMSNELCKMRDEGLIVFNKSHFTLI